MIVLLYKYIRKKERTQEALAQRSIPTKFEMETTKKQQKEMKKQTGYYNIRGRKDPYGDLLVVKPGINKWTELTYKKKKKKKSGGLEGFSVKEGMIPKEDINKAVDTGEMPKPAVNQKVIMKETAQKNNELKPVAGKPMAETSIDAAHTKCNAISDCDDLANAPDCGYCAATDSFYYGTNKGPKTQVCQTKDWGKTVEECKKMKDRAMCAQVTDCSMLIGKKGERCGYCPTAGIGMVAKPDGSVPGKFISKYAEDKCDAPVGLLKADKCAQWLKDNPCSTPKWNTGPHTEACIRKLWTNSKCTTTDKINGQDITAYKNIMKPFTEIGKVFQDTHTKSQAGGDVNKARTFQKLCFGKTTADPCEPKYDMSLECRKKQYLANSCELSGQGYPSEKNYNSWPVSEKKGRKAFTQKYKEDVLKNSFDYTGHVSKMSELAQADAYSPNDFKKKKEASLFCFGDIPDTPDPMRPGDFIEYKWRGHLFQGYVYEITGPYVGVLWTYYKMKDGKEYRRDGVKQDEEKKNWGWPRYPPKGERLKGLGDKNFFVPKYQCKILKRCPKGNAVSLCNITCFTILEDLKNKYPMPRDCVVSAWGKWGGCSKPCATMNDDGTAVPGIALRSRTVVYPSRRGGIECPPLTDTKKCNTIPCRHKDFSEQQKANFKGIKANQVGIFNNNYIHIRQIEVYDVTGKNIALNKPATQSSTYSTFNVSDVTKNNTAYAHTNNRTTATNKKFGSNEWIIVDLGATYEVIKVNIKKTTSVQTQNNGAQVILMNKDGAEVYLVQPGDARRTLKSEQTDSQFLYGSDNFPYSLEDKRGACDEVRNNDYTSTRKEASGRRVLGDIKTKEKQGKWNPTVYNKKWYATIFNWRQTYKNVLKSKPAQWCRWVAGAPRYYSKHIPGYYRWQCSYSRGHWWGNGWWGHWHGRWGGCWRRWTSCRWAWTRNGNYPGRWTCTYSGKRSWYWVRVKDKLLKNGVRQNAGYYDDFSSVKTAGARGNPTTVRINPEAKATEWKKGSKYAQTLDGLKQAATDANDYKVDKTKEGNCLGNAFKENKYFTTEYGGGDCDGGYQQRTVKSLGACAQECLNLGEKCNRFTFSDPNKNVGPAGSKGAGCRISDGSAYNNVAGVTDGYCAVDSVKQSLKGIDYNNKFNQFGGKVYDKRNPTNGKNPPNVYYPKFIGWYKDNVSRALPTRAENNPKDWTRQQFRDDSGSYPGQSGLYHQLTACSGKCSVLGKKYFGLQYWGECWCGNDINQAKKYGKTAAQGWHSQTGMSGHGFFGNLTNKVYKTKKMVYKQTYGPYTYTNKTAAAKCEKEGLVLCPKRVLVGKSDASPDRSVCSGGWTSDSSTRIYPMMYTKAGCGKKGVNTMSGSLGSAHCCEYIDEDPNGKTVPGAGGTYTPSIGAAAATQDYASANNTKKWTTRYLRTGRCANYRVGGQWQRTATFSQSGTLQNCADKLGSNMSSGQRGVIGYTSSGGGGCTMVLPTKGTASWSFPGVPGKQRCKPEGWGGGWKLYEVKQ